jgi:hypothetical protein
MVEWELGEETEVLGENPPQCQFDYCSVPHNVLCLKLKSVYAPYIGT